MIPKIIHYCWLSGDEYPLKIKNCIDTWKNKLPDYEFILWDTNKFDLNSNIWVKQAFENKKYAFAADYIRLYAVYTYGGIYLDTDVEVLKSFNDLIGRPYFIGTEGFEEIEAAVFGAEKNCTWLKVCLDYYQEKTFVNEDNSFNMITLPKIMKSQISKKRNFKIIKPNDITAKKQKEKILTLFMFPKDYFCAKNHGTGVIESTDNTYCIHHFAMSWLPKNQTLLANTKRRLMALLGVNIINNIINLLGLRKLKRLFSKNIVNE